MTQDPISYLPFLSITMLHKKKKKEIESSTYEILNAIHTVEE